MFWIIHHMYSLSPVLENRGRQPYLNRTSLASTCHHLSTLFYEVLYRENQFIFELASTSCRVTTNPPRSLFMDVAIWSREVASTTDGFMHLTPTTAPYLRRVSLIVTRDRDEFCHDDMQHRIEHLVSLLNTAKRLDKLFIHMSTTPLKSYRPAFYYPVLANRLRSCVDANGGFELKLESRHWLVKASSFKDL